MSDWPSPFWAGKLDQWLLPPILEWEHSETRHTIRFQATFVQPEHVSKETVNAGWWPGGHHYAESELPLIFWFGGMDCPAGMEGFGLRAFSRAVRKACILVTPFRQKGTWWILNKGGDWGHVDGELDETVEDALIAWVKQMCRLAAKEGCVDSYHPKAIGFSAGAYALTELITRSAPKPLFWLLGLGGLHGHGQKNTDDIHEHWRRKAAQRKWDDFLERIRTHGGVPGGIYAFHHGEDIVCPINGARAILGVLNRRQEKFQHEVYQLQELHQIDKGSRATTAKQRAQGKVPQMHAYQDTAFLQPWFLQLLLDTSVAHAEGTNGARHEARSRSRRRNGEGDRVPTSARLRRRSRSNDSRRRNGRGNNGNDSRRYDGNNDETRGIRSWSNDSRRPRNRRSTITLVARRG